MGKFRAGYAGKKVEESLAESLEHREREFQADEVATEATAVHAETPSEEINSWDDLDLNEL